MKRLDEARFFERLEARSKGTEEEYQEAVREYFTFGIACPFLEDESCSIHTVRPVTCREYLVTSPPEFCASASGEGVRNVRHLFQVKESVITIARNKQPRELPYVPLIRVMEWTDKNKDESPELPAREWLGRFFSVLLKFSTPASE
jgi:Fe-S-cluster containining protein